MRTTIPARGNECAEPLEIMLARARASSRHELSEVVRLYKVRNNAHESWNASGRFPVGRTCQ